jgi:uncharacterized membrane protein
VEAFSDGVFAIAITLLVLDLSIPEADFDDLWQAIGDLWPSYLAYATSFWTIGGVWLVHHALFRRMGEVSFTLMRLNLLLLLVVAFLPFPTSLVAEALVSEGDEGTAVLFYGATLLVISSVFAVLARYVMTRDELIGEGVSPEDLRPLLVRIAPAPSTTAWSCSLRWWPRRWPPGVFSWGRSPR